MAFSLIKNVGGQTEASFEEVDATGQIGIGDIVMRHPSVYGVIRAQNSVNASISITKVFGVAVTAKTSAGTAAIRVIPIVAGQLWEADSASNTAVNQLMCRNALSSASVVNNSSTDSNDTTAIFLIHAIKGAVSDKKVIGEIFSFRGGTSL